MVEYLNIGRITILERPVALPGSCNVCGTSDKRVVDFGLSIPMHGAVYICVTCFTSVAGELGFIEKPKTDDFEARLKNYLESYNLKVVSDEQYIFFTNTISNLRTFTEHGFDFVSVENSVSDGETPRDFDGVIENILDESTSENN